MKPRRPLAVLVAVAKKCFVVSLVHISASAALDLGINQLVRSLETEPSVLRLTYYENGEGAELANERMDEVEFRVRRRLRRSQFGVDLWIEKRVVKR